MDALGTLSKELGYPSSAKLYGAVQRRNMNGISRQDVEAFVRGQAVRQVFRKRPRFGGRIAAVGINDRWAADLIDYTSKPSVAKDSKSPYQYVLLVQDIFSRKLFGHALRSKDPETVEHAFESIMQVHGKPARLDTDGGAEFKGPFDALLNSDNVAHVVADQRSKNARATLDSAIKSFRQTLARIQASERTRDWATLVPRVLSTYNDTVHDALVGRAPGDVVGDKDLQFTLEGQAAKVLQHNSQAIEQRADRLTAYGGFRAELASNNFERSFHPKYGSEVHKVSTVVGDRVFDDQGQSFPTRHLQAVPTHSEAVNVAGLGKGSAQKDARERLALAPFKERILAHVGSGSTLQLMAQYMKSIGTDEVLKQGLNYKKALQLFGLTVDERGRVTVPRRRALVRLPPEPRTPAAKSAAVVHPKRRLVRVPL